MLNRSTFTLALLTAFALFALPQSRAQTETILHTFTGQPDGQGPFDTLILDSSGNLYGTTSGGGATGGGTVFELSPNSSGGWTETILYNFDSASSGAYQPWGGLVFDSAGNLYGTTYYGGAYGYGTVFELKQKNGRWAEKILHNFNNNGKDGTNPHSNLIFDSAGNLYGTTPTGGTSNGGTVFQLTPKSSGAWGERVLCSFNLDGKVNPNAEAVVFDSAGNLYGTVDIGGTYGYGFAYELTPQTNGGWKEKVLFNFDSSDGAAPTSNLLIDSSGNLYGSAEGVVFELSPGKKAWTETILTNFSGFGIGNIAFDSAGNIFGATQNGGSNYDGSVFESSPAGDGKWTQTQLYSFVGGSDGASPIGGVVLDSSGNIYGTTLQGGSDGEGVVWEITP
jgi:uncharacterized repeat protein (TIGR03803 family)